MKRKKKVPCKIEKLFLASLLLRGGYFFQLEKVSEDIHLTLELLYCMLGFLVIMFNLVEVSRDACYSNRTLSRQKNP